MPLRSSIKNVFVQLTESLNQLSPEQYRKPSKILFRATIGQHVRHIIELFICLEQGYETGIVNYENRKRNLRIETDKELAKSLLLNIYTRLDRPNKDVVLEAAFDENSSEVISIASNYYREIAYNLEHTVHHMALIRVGINEVSNVVLPACYGVASSTIKFRNTCVQ